MYKLISQLLTPVPAAAGTHAEARERRIVSAILTSFLSKGATALLQFLALPLVAGRLGPEAFGIFAMLGALPALLAFAEMGIGPSLALKIADAEATGDRESQSLYFRAGARIMGIASGIMLLACAVSVAAGALPYLFGPDYSRYEDEVKLAAGIIVGIVVLSWVASLGARARAGFQETHVNNLFGVASNALTAIAILIAVQVSGSIPVLAAVVYGVAALCSTANVFVLLWRRPYLWGVPRRPIGPAAGYLLRDSIFFLAATGLLSAQREVAKLFLGVAEGPESSGEFTVLVSIMNLFGGLIVSLTSPIWPAVADARARGDHAWLLQLARRLNRVGWLAGLVSGGAIAIFGDLVMTHLYHDIYPVMRETWYLLSAYCIILILGHVRFAFLMGCNATKQLSLVSTAEFACNMCFVAVLGRSLTVSTLIVLLSVTHLVWSVVVQSLVQRRQLHRGIRQPRDAPVASVIAATADSRTGGLKGDIQ